MAYKLPPLRFGYDALEPYIDAETMELHHDAHHQTYVDNLNKAIEPYPQLADLAIEDLLRRLDQVPEVIRTAVRNHGGGHANHQFFWTVLGPTAGGSPKGAIADAITKDFGSFERFQSLFTDAATKQFGSGRLGACARLHLSVRRRTASRPALPPTAQATGTPSVWASNPTKNEPIGVTPARMRRTLVLVSTITPPTLLRTDTLY